VTWPGYATRARSAPVSAVEHHPSLRVRDARDVVLGASQYPEPLALCQWIDHRWSSTSLLRILPHC
jgi:hypothetical protein